MVLGYDGIAQSVLSSLVWAQSAALSALLQSTQLRSTRKQSGRGSSSGRLFSRVSHCSLVSLSVLIYTQCPPSSCGFHGLVELFHRAVSVVCRVSTVRSARRLPREPP